MKKYREEKLQGTGITPVFPLFGSNTRDLAAQMLDAGVETLISCLDPAEVDRAWAGQLWNHGFLNSLSAGIDPCAENGEFHTVCLNGPMFTQRLNVRSGQIVERDGFVFADIVPA